MAGINHSDQITEWLIILVDGGISSGKAVNFLMRHFSNAKTLANQMVSLHKHGIDIDWYMSLFDEELEPKEIEIVNRGSSGDESAVVQQWGDPWGTWARRPVEKNDDQLVLADRSPRGKR